MESTFSMQHFIDLDGSGRLPSLEAVAGRKLTLFHGADGADAPPGELAGDGRPVVATRAMKIDLSPSCACPQFVTHVLVIDSRSEAESR